MSDSEEDFSSQSDDESAENEYLDGKKNVTIILIDVGTSMFDTPRIFKTCLLAIYQVMDQMLLKAHKRNISVCLLRDDDIVLTALNTNFIESTKTIYDLLQTSIDTLRTKFERKNPASLRYTLTECIKQLYSFLEKVNPYIVVLTNDEDPIRGDQNEKLSAIDVALSFKELNVKLVVLPLKEKFNYGLFYKELLKAANDAPLDIFQEDDEQSYTSVDDLTDILHCVIKDKVSIKRHKFRIYNYKKKEKQPFFWTQMRYFISNSNLNQNSIISRSNNNNLKQGLKEEKHLNMNQYIVEEDEDTDPITYSNDDYLFVQMPYGFQLLHVAEEKQGSLHYTTKRGFLLQFDETDKNNKGKEIFDSMWEYCKNKNRYLICGFHSPGNKQHPNLVELSADIFQSKPCFTGQFLTNCDEIEDENEEEDKEEEHEKFDKNDPDLGLVCDLIDKMKLKKYPYHWNEYSYELKAANIKAQFLDIEPQEVESCLPTDEEITEQLGATNTELQEIFGGIDEPAAPKRSKK